jgi:multiple sugar transport system substrate-binding protein
MWGTESRRLRKLCQGVAIMVTMLLVAACGSGSGGAPAQSATAKVKMTYWGGLIFSDAANKLLSNRVKQWGQANNVAIDVVMINQNETNTKVAAAVESGTLPDVFDMGLELAMLLSTKGQLVPVDDLYTKIGQDHGGWMKSIHVGIPFGASGNLLNIRKDALEQAGITTTPKSWQELADSAEKAQKPPLYGMGFALSNVGDGNLQLSVLQSFGGRVADDTGKKVTLKSPETKAYMEWVTAAFKKKLFPPGATTWDGAGDNNAYQAGQAIFIANPGSVYLWMKQNDKDLLAGSTYAALPVGPKGRVSPITVNLRGIAKSSKNVEKAKQLIEYLADKQFMDEYYKVAIYGPVLKEQLAFDIFKDPYYGGLADLVQNGTPPAWPDVNNAAYAEFSNNYIVPKMIQRVVVDGWAIDRAIDEAQKAAEAIYGKYN